VKCLLYETALAASHVVCRRRGVWASSCADHRGLWCAV
jgi:hypothetical protein